MSLPAAGTPIKVGLRVMRGPDWKWAEQDGGQGHVGTVIEVGHSSHAVTSNKSAQSGPKDTVVVQWDNGARSNYRIGYEGAFDLRVVDNASIGVRHRGFVCSECQTTDFFGLRWRSITNAETLCSRCYMSDKGDTTHEHRRFDFPESTGSVVVPARRKSHNVLTMGIFEGAKVGRGQDWVWENQDGGKGNVGQVVSVEGWEDDTDKSVAKVYWPAVGQSFHYRVGHRGKSDLKFVQAAPGGYVYHEHLPVLGQMLPANAQVNAAAISPPPTANREAKTSQNDFSVAEIVRISVDAERLQVLQDGHGGFNPKMSKLIGKVGRVHRITASGDVRVQYPGDPEASYRWTVHPGALSRLPSLKVGDQVKVNKDMGQVRRQQVGHGEWCEEMRDILGRVATVTKVYADGDIRIQVGEKAYNMSAATVTPCQSSERKEKAKTNSPRGSNTPSTPESEEAAHFVSDCAKGRLDRIRGFIERARIQPIDIKVIRKGLQSAARHGHLHCVRYLVGLFPDQVDARHSGKTPLHVSVHQGHLDVVDFLLSAGARLSTPDEAGDQALHYAAFGKQPTVMAFILEREGYDVNAFNAKGCSPLHVSVIIEQEECVRALLQRNAKVNLREAYGDSALHEAINKENNAIIDLILTAPEIDLRLSNEEGFNALQFAALKGNVHAAKAILAKDPSLINESKADGFTPLHVACLNGRISVIKVLLNAVGAKVNAKDANGRTPLHQACFRGNFKVVEILLHNDDGNVVDVNAMTGPEGDTPLHIALSREDAVTGAGNLKHDVDEAVLSQVQCAGVPETLWKWASLGVLLILNGADPNRKNRSGLMPLDRVADPNTRNLILEKTLEINTSSSSSLEAVKSNPDELPKRRPSKKKSQLEECRVCSEMSTLVTFMPCGHSVVCDDCSVRMKKCLECKMNIDEKIQAVGQQSPAMAAAKSSERLRDLEAKVQDWEDHYNCSICMERKKNVVFLCGHGSCSDCVETLKCCHMCRKPIDRTINMY